MKKFIAHIVIIVGAVLAANYVYVLMIGGNLRDYSGKYITITQNPRMLILGDSHASRAWLANSDKSIVNFAYGSDNIHDMLLKMEYATKEKGPISAVVLSFEPHLISTYRGVKNNNRTTELLNSSPLNIRVTTSLPLIFDPNTEFDLKMFIYRTIRKRSEHKPAFEYSTQSANTRYEEQFGNGAISTALLKEYQLLIDKCRALDCDVIALKYPVQPYYDSLISSRTESLRMRNMMDSLAARNALSIIDVSDGFHEKSLFSDYDHLNIQGSKLFIKRFMDTYEKAN